MEIWCYACKKWIGVYDSHPYEKFYSSNVSDAFTPGLWPNLRAMAKENERRQRERTIFGLSKNDIFYFIESRWWRSWRSFLVGNASYPPAIDNSILMEDNKLLPDLSLMVDFHILSEGNWKKVQGIYGGGPALSEGDIDGPQHEHLKRQLRIWRA